MKVLSTFLFLSSALAQRNASNIAPVTGDIALMSEVAAIPEEVAVATSAVPADEAKHIQGGANAPLFDFDLAPYNVALDIVAEALEKLADTMEPLDVPLPLIGPGYYLEVQVKSPKSPLTPPPAGGENMINIEGGQALPVTEIEIILPGDTEVHQTIILPGATNKPSMPVESAKPTISVSASIPEEEPVSDAYTVSIVEELESHSLSISAEHLVPGISGTLEPPIPAGTESAASPLLSTSEEIALSEPTQSVPVNPLSPTETDSGPESLDELENMSSAEETAMAAEAQSAASSEAEPGSALEFSSEEDLDPVIEGAYGSSVSLEVQSLVSSTLSSPDAASSSTANDMWAGLFPGAASSAPSVSEESSKIESSMQSEMVLQPKSATTSNTGSELDMEPASNLDTSEPNTNMPVSVPAESSEEVTMASELLPFPPFGGPQTQQPPVSGLDNPDSMQAAATTDNELSGSEDNLIETISIIGADNENALESSIDAVLHSVIQDYQSESIPKAAVGFALIHPRSAALLEEF
ncbi:hypothetical protein IWW36_002505 [Coemansia brasiliensis]|uniref:Uncharacterized protein n=1 Tax=Coemansia brasiliensis TaxID=2650707 RepID=A0A9W8I9H6_9FUNG|nr:hypothetical protein IWW36_002505 [Coemansia brasiliensis]